MKGFEDFTRPVTITAILLALLGILFSWYFYKKSEKIGEISTRVDQVQIFDKSRMGKFPLRLLDPSGTTITNNVYVANVVIWNSGSAEIKKSDIRQVFKIQIGSGLSPLELTPIGYTDNNEDHFHLSFDGVFTWENFDPGEGIKVRVVYVHDFQQSIWLMGRAAGIRVIDQPPAKIAKGVAASIWAAQMSFGFVGLSLLLMSLMRPHPETHHPTRRVALTIRVLGAVLLIGALIYPVFVQTPPYPDPPF